MANHGQQRNEARRANHYAKPSRQKRHERRWDARVKEMEAFIATRNADHDRAMRIVEYLARRAERRVAEAA